MLTSVAIRVLYAMRAHPVLRIVIGLVLLLGGALEIALGAGHGGLVVMGAALVAGGFTAAVSAARDEREDE